MEPEYLTELPRLDMQELKETDGCLVHVEGVISDIEGVRQVKLKGDGDDEEKLQTDTLQGDGVKIFIECWGLSAPRWEKLTAKLMNLQFMIVSALLARQTLACLARIHPLMTHIICAQSAEQTMRSTTSFLISTTLCWCDPDSIHEYENRHGRFRECLDCGSRWKIEDRTGRAAGQLVTVEHWLPEAPRQHPGGPLIPVHQQRAREDTSQEKKQERAKNRQAKKSESKWSATSSSSHSSTSEDDLL